ncbi:MAG: hypothetical protein K9J16_08855 [Melioribacteraceae bacterium]|nr:hypothetical protein [Melioribacteraceae bacterium]MCF8353972.1 hypothetical protein [Melioribacteraceae bacterium]MCF8393700.1 hypothetical protein [Melioribacteraceae bacterium]MCF8419558.1 hypothetical protein [Melioribacteraceae bacterium]
MKIKHLPYLVFIAIFILSCGREKFEDDSTITGNNFTAETIIGKLTVEGKPIADAEIKFSGKDSVVTFSDNNGFFQIKNVTAGDHLIEIKKEFDDGKMIITKELVSVTKGSKDIGVINFTEPPTLNNIEPADITELGIPLNWTQSQNDFFNEYRLIRSNNNEVTLESGSIIFVTGIKSITTYSDKFYTSGTRYYYRVASIENFSTISYSNIISVVIE